MHDNGNDIPRLPAEDMVRRSTDVPDVAHDDERNAPERTGEAEPPVEDLDPQLTD